VLNEPLCVSAQRCIAQCAIATTWLRGRECAIFDSSSWYCADYLVYLIHMEDTCPQWLKKGENGACKTTSGTPTWQWPSSEVNAECPTGDGGAAVMT
jgi:hypothetical protein